MCSVRIIAVVGPFDGPKLEFATKLSSLHGQNSYQVQCVRYTAQDEFRQPDDLPELMNRALDAFVQSYSRSSRCQVRFSVLLE